jgi:hypothetical protein
VSWGPQVSDIPMLVTAGHNHGFHLFLC